MPDESRADKPTDAPPPLPPLPTFAAPRNYVTADIPGTAGVIKQRPEDFLVEEIPSYDPCGSGEHIYLMVQKTGLSTLRMVQILAGHFRVRESAVGYAGLKDKHAITRQQVSIHTPGRGPQDFPSVTHPSIVVLGATLHNNKLRRGRAARLRRGGCAVCADQ